MLKILEINQIVVVLRRNWMMCQNNGRTRDSGVFLRLGIAWMTYECVTAASISCVVNYR